MPNGSPHRAQRLSLAISLALLSLPATAQFAAVQPLSALNGSNGFRLDGVAAGDNSGGAVSSAGDVNGDGLDDLIIGAYGADPNGINNSGSSYVVFGRRAGFAAAINLSTLDGSNGFRLDGVAMFDSIHGGVSAAGDINGDGLDDLIIGARGADPNGTVNSGSSYLVFGRSTGFAATINLSTLDGSNGFRLDGVAAGDYSGRAVSAVGDVNGDGLDDLIIGAYGADPNGTDSSGSSYVVFGRSTRFASAINLSTLDGINGFRLDGVAAYDSCGIAVSSADDLNGDGIDDLIIGAPYADPNGDRSGSSYVVFGRSTGFAPAINLFALDGGNGFRLDGVAQGDYSGRAVSAAGDVNGDGLDDLIIGAVGAAPNGSRSGSSYVVFGRSTGFASAINLSTLNGSTGFRLDGVAAGDYSGLEVSAAGDVNADGIDDLIIGARGATPNGRDSGSSYVVFGSSTGLGSGINLSTLNGSNGFRLDGVTDFDGSGEGVSAAGDVNADGIDDLIIGARGASPNGSRSGSSYVVFGRTARFFRDGFEAN
jgi:hypothetical protein